MGWEDPSPRRQGRSPPGNPAAQPGHADPGVRLSFGTIVLRWGVALLIGVVVYAGAHHGLGAWLGPAHRIAEGAMSLSSAVVIGGLSGRALMRMPQPAGRWNDSSDLDFDVSDVPDAVGAVVGVVGAIVDAATD